MLRDISSLDTVWILLCTALVLLMQAGFCCLESGMVRSKNSINVAVKNLADLCFSVLAFWMFGFSWNGLFGSNHFFIANVNDPHDIAIFLYQACFCGTASTIVSGAIAERTRLSSYLILTFFISSLLYPLYGHWVWADACMSNTSGWLQASGFRDFAGSSVVHSMGGWFALAAVLVVGPRNGRFSERENPYIGKNLDFSTLGVFLLLFGWLGFNGGGELKYSSAVPSILSNTILASMAGGVASHLLSLRVRRHVDVSDALNGTLAGLVAITSCCHVVTPTQSV